MRTLASLVAERGPLGVRDAIGWTLRCAMTLWALHEEGTVHGRVSPSAILVDDLDCRSDGLLVRPGLLEDDPNYHSLPRARGEPPSEQDDVWAVGITLFFALTGQLPYPHGLLRPTGKLRQPAPLAVHGAALDVMQPVIDRIIRADRGDRLQAAREVVAGLRDLSPAIADLEPLAIERPFISEDADTPTEIDPVAPSSSRRRAIAKHEQPTPRSAREVRQPIGQTRWLAIGLVSALAVGVAAFLVSSPPSVETSLAGAPPSNPPPPSETIDAPPPAASPSPTPSAEPMPSAVVQPAGSRATDAGDADFATCAGPMFAADAFTRKPVTAPFPCDEVNPVVGAQIITTLLATGGAGTASKAAVEWSNLGWYRAAAFAVARGGCCASPPKLESPRLIAVCALDPVLENLSAAMAAGSDDQLAVALERYGAAASCVGTAGGGAMFHTDGVPKPGQAALLIRMMSRLRVARAAPH